MHKKMNRAVCVLLALVIAAALMKSFIIDTGDGRIPVGEMTVLNEQWKKELKQDETGEYWELAYTIPEKSGQNLIFSIENSWASISVLLDGRELYSCQDIYREYGARRHWIELPGDASGKVLSVEVRENLKFVERMMKSPMYVGEKNAVLLESVLSDFYALAFFFFAVILVLIILFYRIGLKSELSESNLRKMNFLEIFALDVGIWVLTDSEIMQIFTGKTAVIELVSFVTFLLMPLFMILYIKEMMVYPWKIFDMLFVIGSINTMIILGVYLLRIAPIYKLLFLQHILIIAAIPVILKRGIIEIKRYRNRGMKKVITGFGLLSLFGVIALAMFYSPFSVNYAYFYSVGVLLFMMCLAWAVFEDIYYYLEESAKVKVYKKMIYIDVMTGMENRAAFDKVIEKEISAKGITYIVFDNNNLKKINDNQGHQAGDRLIIETGKCIKDVFGRLGRCFRIGGDEFLVILRGMSESEVRGSLEHFDRKIEERNSKGDIHIEISYGYFSCTDASMTLAELFQKADANMYSRKREMKHEEEREA